MQKGKRLWILQKKRGRCSGDCCACFYLPHSPEELEAKYTRWQRGPPSDKRAAMHMSGDTSENATTIDIHLIFPMLIYLGQDVMPRQVRKVERDSGRHFYSCKHWNQKTGNCTIYEHRPQMCREYPYGSKCNYAACTWKSRKFKPETAKERRDRRRAERAESEDELKLGPSNLKRKCRVRRAKDSMMAWRRG